MTQPPCQEIPPAGGIIDDLLVLQRLVLQYTGVLKHRDTMDISIGPMHGNTLFRPIGLGGIFC